MKIISGCIILPIFFGCNIKSKNSDYYIEKFYQNKSEFIGLTRLLRDDTLTKMKFGETLNWTFFDIPVKTKLQKLDIKAVHIFTWEIKQRQFDFNTNWDTSMLVHVYYNTYDTSQTKKGFYKREGVNELWGLGDGWALW